MIQGTTSSYKIFLSHSKKDQWVCQRIGELLNQVGVDTLYDAYDFEAGRDIGQEVKEGIRQSNELLVLLSPASLDSDWVKHEAGIADAFDMPITLVLLHVSLDDRPSPLNKLLAISMDELDEYASRHSQKQEVD